MSLLPPLPDPKLAEEPLVARRKPSPGKTKGQAEDQPNTVSVRMHTGIHAMAGQVASAFHLSHINVYNALLEDRLKALVAWIGKNANDPFRQERRDFADVCEEVFGYRPSADSLKTVRTRNGRPAADADPESD